MPLRKLIRVLFNGFVFLSLIALPSSSIIFDTLFLSNIVRDFFFIGLNTGLEIGIILNYLATLSISSVAIALYIYFAFYVSENQFSEHQKISISLVTSFMLVSSIRFIKFFTPTENYIEVSTFVSDFAVLLPILASAKVLKLYFDRKWGGEMSDFDIVKELSGKLGELHLETLAINLVYIPIFAISVLIFERVLLARISQNLFVVYGPLFILIIVTVAAFLCDKDFSKFAESLIDETS